MSFTEKPNKNRRIIENVAFVCAFGFIMYNLISTYWRYAYASIKGQGYIGAIIDPLRTHEYYKSFISVMIILNATCVLWKILMLIIQLLKQERGNTHGYHKFKRIFKQVSVNYKPSFLALLILELLPKLFFIHMFWIWLPHIQKIALFTINLKWYSWIYAYLCWEFSTWIFHFAPCTVFVVPARAASCPNRIKHDGKLGPFFCRKLLFHYCTFTYFNTLRR